MPEDPRSDGDQGCARESHEVNNLQGGLETADPRAPAGADFLPVGKCLQEENKIRNRKISKIRDQQRNRVMIIETRGRPEENRNENCK